MGKDAKREYRDIAYPRNPRVSGESFALISFTSVPFPVTAHLSVANSRHFPSRQRRRAPFPVTSLGTLPGRASVPFSVYMTAFRLRFRQLCGRFSLSFLSQSPPSPDFPVSFSVHFRPFRRHVPSLRCCLFMPIPVIAGLFDLVTVPLSVTFATLPVTISVNSCDLFFVISERIVWIRQSIIS